MVHLFLFLLFVLYSHAGFFTEISTEISETKDLVMENNTYVVVLENATVTYSKVSGEGNGKLIINGGEVTINSYEGGYVEFNGGKLTIEDFAENQKNIKLVTNVTDGLTLKSSRNVNMEVLNVGSQVEIFKVTPTGSNGVKLVVNKIYINSESRFELDGFVDITLNYVIPVNGIDVNTPGVEMKIGAIKSGYQYDTATQFLAIYP